MTSLCSADSILGDATGDSDLVGDIVPALTLRGLLVSGDETRGSWLGKLVGLWGGAGLADGGLAGARMISRRARF